MMICHQSRKYITSKVLRPPFSTYLRTHYEKIVQRSNSTYIARKKLIHLRQVLMEEVDFHPTSSQTSDPSIQSTIRSAVNESSTISASPAYRLTQSDCELSAQSVDPGCVGMWQFPEGQYQMERSDHCNFYNHHHIRKTQLHINASCYYLLLMKHG